MLNKFSLGQLLMSREVAERVAEGDFDTHEIIQLVRRHIEGDWGEIVEEDVRANEEALESGDRILSAYRINGEKLWIITEAKDYAGIRQATTILFPSEY